MDASTSCLQRCSNAFLPICANQNQHTVEKSPFVRGNSDIACANTQWCTYVKVKGGSALSIMCEICYTESRLTSVLIYAWLQNTLWQEQVVIFRTSKLCRKLVAMMIKTEKKPLAPYTLSPYITISWGLCLSVIRLLLNHVGISERVIYKCLYWNEFSTHGIAYIPSTHVCFALFHTSKG